MRWKGFQEINPILHDWHFNLYIHVNICAYTEKYVFTHVNTRDQRQHRWSGMNTCQGKGKGSANTGPY